MISQTLTRFAGTKAHPNNAGTFGRLGPWVTIEEEWQNNQPRISCIPTDSYLCRRSMFHRGGYATFEVMEVDGRNLIKFHIANTEEDLLGCIGLGLGLGVLRVRDEDTGQFVHKLAVLSSRSAFDAWMATMDGVEEFILHVVDHPIGED